MHGRIAWWVHDASSVTVVRLAGWLDLTTTRIVHDVLQRCLAAQPDALVVDLSRLRVADPLALAIFAAASRQAADWPAVPMVLSSPAPEAARLLAQTTTCRVVPVHHDWIDAAREARSAALPRLRARLLPVKGACRRARELAIEACDRWQLPDLVGPVSLVLSELVGNVVRHARTPMDVTITLRRPYLHLAVSDGCRAEVRPRDPDPLTEGGRGLLLIREIAQRWGTLPAGDGKVVWAVVPAA